MLFWEVYYKGSWVEMPTPIEYKVNGEDLDLDSYRSIANGNIVRNILGYKWQKIEFSFNFMYEQDVIDVINKVAYTYPLKIRVKTPFSANKKQELTGYISKMNGDCVYTQSGYGYVLSFNFVEGLR